MNKLQTTIAVLAVIIVALIVTVAAKYCHQIEGNEQTSETATTSTETTTTEPILSDSSTEETTETTTTENPSKSLYVPSPKLEPATLENGYVSPEFFKKHGVIYGNGNAFTWYSEKVLPGGGLNIPGRWSDGNYVRDEDGYIVMASGSIPYGTVIDSPFGEGKIYDYCETPGVVDVYTSF